jgi:hypothetical protein
MRLRGYSGFMRVFACAGLAGAALALAGCGGSVIESPSSQAEYGCMDDSKACIDQRQIALKSLVSDKSRGWVKQPASAAAYASGVRMFAFKTEKQRMTCDELSSGRREADGAPRVLRSSQAQGLTPAQVSRGIMFAEEVSRELTREALRRCKV